MLQITLAAILSGSALLANAEILVDTGSPVSTQNGAISVISYPYETQSVGRDFLSQAHITSQTSQAISTLAIQER